MSKKLILIISSSVVFLIICLIIGYFGYTTEQNKKLTVNYAIAQCKIENEKYNEIDTTPDDDIKGYYDGIKYVCYNKFYNQIVKFKEDAKSNFETVAFRVETPEDIGNAGNKFNYEIGRIVIDTVNSKNLKCTYNYRGNADWHLCKEVEFVKSLPKISILKEEAYEPLRTIIKEMNERELKALQGDGSEYNEAKAEEAYEKFQKQLQVLRNVTLTK